MPAKGVASVSSLSANTSNLGTCGSGVVTTTEVSPELSLPPSSLNLRIYSPSTAGTNVSDTFPGRAGIISTELVNVPVPSVRLLWRQLRFHHA